MLVALGCGLALAWAAVAPAGASDDRYYEQQWNLTQIGAAGAWRASTGSGVTIGIVDTGVDREHPDLKGKIDAVADCVGGSCREGSIRDGHGHGTMVSGIAAAATGNARGVAGIAPDARLVVARAVGDDGKGSVEDIDRAIRWVVDKGAKVVNLSLGDPNYQVVSVLGTPLRPAIDYAWGRGAVPILAAGNENGGSLDPGSSNYGTLNAVVVGATDRAGNVARYSSAIGNAKWGLVAPGGSGAGAGQDILSTFPGDRYAWVAGTSMAAPHVSAAMALLLAQGLTPTAAVQRLLATVDKLACGQGCRGRLNLAAAVGAPATAPPPSTSSTAAPTTTTAPPLRTSTSTTAGPPATTAVAPPTSAVTTTTQPVPLPTVAPGEPSGPGAETGPATELGPPLLLTPDSGDDSSSRGPWVAAATVLAGAAWGGAGAVGRRLVKGGG